MTMLRFLISCTFVLAQRTPLNAAFWTVGLDKTLEERRIEPPKRSEEAMVVLSAMRLEKRAEAVLGSFVDEAQRRRKLLELSLENPKLLGERRTSQFGTQPKAGKARSANSNSSSDKTIHFLEYFLRQYIFCRPLQRNLTLISESPQRKGAFGDRRITWLCWAPLNLPSLAGGRENFKYHPRTSNLFSTFIHHHLIHPNTCSHRPL
jgi:hypothetical protein